MTTPMEGWIYALHCMVRAYLHAADNLAEDRGRFWRAGRLEDRSICDVQVAIHWKPPCPWRPGK